MATSADPGVAFRDAVNALQPPRLPMPPAPTTIEEASPWFGKPRQQNRAIADTAGVSIREAQRWRAFERGSSAQKRRPPPAVVKRITKLARERQLRAWRAAKKAAGFDRYAHVRRYGVIARVEGDVRISKVWEHRVMPVDQPPGQRRHVFIEGGELDRGLEQLEADDIDAAGEELLDAFFQAYGAPVSEVGELTEVEVIAQ